VTETQTTESELDTTVRTDQLEKSLIVIGQVFSTGSHISNTTSNITSNSTNNTDNSPVVVVENVIDTSTPPHAEVSTSTSQPTVTSSPGNPPFSEA